MKTFYRRNLPHIQPSGFCFFATGRLHDSIPRSVMHDLKENYLLSISKIDLQKTAHQQNYEKLKLKKKYVHDIEIALHRMQTGPHYLKNGETAKILQT